MFFSPSYYLCFIEFSLFFIYFEVVSLIYHYLFLGISIIVLGILLKNYNYLFISIFSLGSNFILSLLLLLLGLFSIFYFICVSLFCVWSLLFTDYSTVICIIFYHLYIGLILILGSLLYLFIYFIRELDSNFIDFNLILVHRCSILGHLSYMCVYFWVFILLVFTFIMILCVY